MSDSLFSLEVHVEIVENLKVSCSIPAVSFRLLDFPTLIIHHVSPLMADKLREKSRLANLGKRPVFPELRDHHGNIPFQKGKSCLFKANLNDLHRQLQLTPMYVMLIDLWPKKPKLVGSTVISLKNAISKIRKDVLSMGISVPSFSREEGLYDVHNLMGTTVGKVMLGFRLLSLGGSLIPHIPAESLITRCQETDDGNKHQVLVPEVVVTDNGLGTGDVAIDSDPANIKKAIEERQNTQTQTEKLSPKARRTIKRTQEPDDNIMIITNTVCPPPLYYNIHSHPENAGECRTKSTRDNNGYHDNIKEMSSGNVDEVDYDYYEPGLVQPDGTCGCMSVMVQTEPVDASNGIHTMNRDEMALTSTQVKLDDLPLLSALLKELSHLTAGHGSTEATDLITPMLRQVHVGNEKKADPLKTHRPKTSIADPSEAPKRRTQTTNQKPMHGGVAGLPKKVKFKTTNLTYGTTRTQLMRLEMNQKTASTNARLCESVNEETRSQSSSRLGRESYPGRPFLARDLGKTQTIVPRRNVESQTDSDQVVVKSVKTPNNVDISGLTTGDVQQGQTTVLSKDQDLGSTQSLVSQNSLDVYLPQVIHGESDGNDSENRSSDPLKMARPPPVPPPSDTRYGHTGIESPPSPVPRLNSETTLSQAGRSRASTAMSMYSDDFEDSQVWDSKNKSEDSSDSSSVSHQSISSQTRDIHVDVSQDGVGNEVASANSEKPVKSNSSPIKARSSRKRNGLRTKLEPTKSSSEDNSSSNNFSGVRTPSLTSPDVDPLERNPTITIQSQQSVESVQDNSKGESMAYSDEFHSVASDGNSDQSYQSVVQKRNILDLPRPSNVLGYTY